jgi:tetratricopeptide (TPR) repeat protein
MALGREEYAGQQYEQAAEAFAKVSSNDADALEAGFLRGLSLLFSGDYVHAEEAFAGVARVLPLAEVLNNQGVALARQGKDGAPLFRQAVAADISSADFHFNLAVSAKRRGDLADALAELTLCLRLRPNDNEALELQKEWGNPVKAALPKTSAATQDEKADAKADPLERIERGFDAVAFHQAALMLDQVDAAHLAQLAPRERAVCCSKLNGSIRRRSLPIRKLPRPMPDSLKFANAPATHRPRAKRPSFRSNSCLRSMHISFWRASISRPDTWRRSPMKPARRSKSIPTTRPR